MEEITNFLNSTFGEIPKWKNLNCIKLINNKISIKDAIKYRFNYSQINKIKEEIKSSLNFDNNEKFYRISYDRKENMEELISDIIEISIIFGDMRLLILLVAIMKPQLLQH